MDHAHPRIVVAENVPHLAKIGKGSVIDKIVADLETAGPGYRFEVWNLFAPKYGVPQNRTRLFFVGVRSDIQEHPVKPDPTHDAYRTIDWAIGDLEQILDETVPNQSQYFNASKAKKGNGQGDEVSRAGTPAYTVRANAKSRVQFHYGASRRLTVRECARLQTFPDTFVFPHSATTNVMQVGNAVPPLLATQVAQSIATFLNHVDHHRTVQMEAHANAAVRG
jgi:DNA (cytosine-5)-methyltransferase 1